MGRLSRQVKPHREATSPIIVPGIVHLSAKNTIRLGFWKPEMGSLANSASPTEVARAKSNQQNLSVSNYGG
jgi:hypothetical protein